MPDLRRRAEVLAFVILCSISFLLAGWHMRHWGDALSPVDAFSEANTVREVYNFREHGITANAGLGNVLYPGLYPDEGFAAHPEAFAQSVTPSGVYTHYPPGPEYLLFVAMKLFGPQPLWHSRLLPLAIACAASIFLGFSVRRRFGPFVGWAVMLACTALPVFSDASTFLHYDGYALSLLLVQIGICIGSNTRVLPLLLLGFLQGWLSFDYAFLVAVSPLALEIAMSRLGVGHAARLRLALWRCLVAGAGFAVAHLLHFAEVWAYLGSFQTALADIATASSRRAGSGITASPQQRLLDTIAVLKAYLIGEHPLSLPFWRPDAGTPDAWRVFRFAGLTVAIWWILLTHVFIGARLVRQHTQATAQRVRPIDNDWLVASLCGLIPSVLWYVVMLNHAFEHTHFLYRHLFFAYFVWLLFCATALAEGWLPSAQASVRLRISSTLRKNAP